MLELPDGPSISESSSEIVSSFSIDLFEVLGKISTFLSLLITRDEA